jgi:hypothetical protein
MSSEALTAAALRAGLVDLDALALVDMSRDDGTVKGANALMAEFKREKPHLFVKHMRNMNEIEQKMWWEEHARRFPGGAPPPKPMPLDKTAKQMSPSERSAFLKECARRWG